MKRSRRLLIQARQCAGWCLVNLAAAVCATVWAIRAAMSNEPGGVLLFLVALVALSAAWIKGARAVRLFRNVSEEIFWDRQRSIRPRL